MSTLSSLQTLEAQLPELALEAFNPMAIPGVFKNLVQNVFQAFQFSGSLTDVEPLPAFPRELVKFLKVVDAVSYSELGELKAYVPEGLNKTYLEYLAVLQPACHALATLQSQVLEPFCLFLGQLLSDPKAGLSSFNNRLQHEKLEKRRAHYYKQLGQCFDRNSHNAETKIKKVVDRNADWRKVLTEINECVQSLERIDRQAIKTQVQQCTDYIELLVKEFSQEAHRAVSQEVAQRLANEAYQIAKELEFYSTTYYRALALRGSIENTMKHVQSVLG